MQWRALEENGKGVEEQAEECSTQQSGRGTHQTGCWGYVGVGDTGAGGEEQKRMGSVCCCQVGRPKAPGVAPGGATATVTLS